MKNKECLSALAGRLIVSCQALPDEPLYSDFVMAKMATAAMLGGAAGIRANSVVDITAIRAVVKLPMIGIIKRDLPDSPVYITPEMADVDALVQTGCELIAMDATARPRAGGQTLDDFFAAVRKKYPDQLFMADVSTLEEGLHAQALGFDAVGTTLCGYTPYTAGTPLPNLELIAALAKALTVPLIAEGGISTPEQLRAAMDKGAHACVVGAAITRPMLITRSFVQALK